MADLKNPTVRDMIRELSHFDLDMPFVVSDGDTGWMIYKFAVELVAEGGGNNPVIPRVVLLPSDYGDMDSKWGGSRG